MLRRILIGLAIVVLVLLGIAYLLPRNVHVERSIAVNAPPSVVFPLVNGYQRFNEYSPWAEYDPEAKYTLSGPETGVGARFEWTGDPKTVGTGSQEIVASEPGRMVRSRLDFGAQGIAESTFKIEPSDSGSEVTWVFDTDLGANPVARYMGLFFDGMIGKDYEKGLEKLKAVAEREAAAATQVTSVAPTVDAPAGESPAADAPPAETAPAR